MHAVAQHTCGLHARTGSGAVHQAPQTLLAFCQTSHLVALQAVKGARDRVRLAVCPCMRTEQAVAGLLVQLVVCIVVCMLLA